ncbi:hypothetical protein [Nannocystis sp. SCPEA4]|uniref:hypothetical protein n=1 Tax=Nannocystis sp. SCPEA4 TaxID=2996787 RepID=UPI0022704CCC|nr:hypothetical protein [Nannocystis sp. SCPEA4]MCY1057471.1 hypothetical protein [Nannocystis sp. SCPEA4]
MDIDASRVGAARRGCPIVDALDQAVPDEKEPGGSAAAEAESGSDIFIGYWNFGGLHFTFDRETDKVIGIRIRGAVC